MKLGIALYATCCGLGYVAASVLLGITLVFLFVTVVSAIAELVEDCVGDDDAGVVASLPRAG